MSLGSMGLRMRLAAFLAMVPAVTVAVVSGPLFAALVQITAILPDNAAGGLSALPFEPNTTLALIGTAAWFAAALSMRRPHLWLGIGVAGPLGFAYFPYGLVRWQGRAFDDMIGLRDAPRAADWVTAALPVVALTVLLVAERMAIDAATFRQRGIDGPEIRRALNASALDVTGILVVGGAAGIAIAYALGRADLAFLERTPFLASAVAAMVVAGVLAMVGLMIVVRAQPAVADAGAPPAVFEAVVDAHDPQA